MRHPRLSRYRLSRILLFVAGGLCLLSWALLVLSSPSEPAQQSATHAQVSPRIAPILEWVQSAPVEFTLAGLFGPPQLYYDANSATCVTELPLAALLQGYQLETIEQPLYRYQYAGHAGHGDTACLTLYDRHTQQWLSVQASQPVAGHRITVITLWAGQETLAHGPPHALYRSHCIAVIYDHTLQQQIYLEVGPTQSPNPVACIRNLDTNELTRLQAGDTLKLFGRTVHLESVSALEGRVQFSAVQTPHNTLTLQLPDHALPVAAQPLTPSPDKEL